MIDALIWVALMMSIGTGVLAVWVFAHLNAGYTIIGDKYNLIELWAAAAILLLVLVALIGLTIRKLKRG